MFLCPSGQHMIDSLVQIQGELHDSCPRCRQDEYDNTPPTSQELADLTGLRPEDFES